MRRLALIAALALGACVHVAPEPAPVPPPAAAVAIPALDVVGLLPPPPAAGTPAELADRAATRAPVSAERVAQARADAQVDPFAAFGPVLGPAFSPGVLPHTDKLLKDVLAAAGPSITAGKKAFARKRPFLLDPQLQTCVPKDEKLAASFAYPSGHTTIGWAWALTLAEAYPAKADAILQRGYEYGLSRIVCGVHWPTDVEAGRTLGAAVVARLHGDTAFRAEMIDARAEMAAAFAAAP